jgi:hypothetical protein
MAAFFERKIAKAYGLVSATHRLQKVDAIEEAANAMDTPRGAFNPLDPNKGA